VCVGRDLVVSDLLSRLRGAPAVRLAGEEPAPPAAQERLANLPASARGYVAVLRPAAAERAAKTRAHALLAVAQTEKLNSAQLLARLVGKSKQRRRLRQVEQGTLDLRRRTPSPELAAATEAAADWAAEAVRPLQEFSNHGGRLALMKIESLHLDELQVGRVVPAAASPPHPPPRALQALKEQAQASKRAQAVAARLGLPGHGFVVFICAVRRTARDGLGQPGRGQRQGGAESRQDCANAVLLPGL
jgi:hypothetical protein